MEMTRQEEARDRENQDKHTNRKSNKPDGVSIPASQETITAPLTVDQALQQLDSLQDKDDKRSYIKSLPPSMQTEVKNALMLAKAEAEKASATQTQLDDELDKLL
jgi:hypothetical protein